LSWQILQRRSFSLDAARTARTMGGTLEHLPRFSRKRKRIGDAL
jgi:hypothetical protein